MRSRVTLFALFLVLSTVISAPAQIIWDLIGGSGLPVANVSLTSWQPGVGYEFQQAYLCWEEQGGGLWFAAWDEGSWTVGLYVRDVGGLGNARPRAVPTMTATGVQPRWPAATASVWTSRWR